MDNVLRCHARELTLLGRCPGCAELIPVGTLLRDMPCPHCDTQLGLFESGGKQVVQTLEARICRQRLLVSIAAGAMALLVGWMPLVSTLVFLGAYLWLRMGVLNPLSQFLSPHRRLITRWTSRLALSCLLVIVLIVSMIMSLLPPIAMVGNSFMAFLKVWLCTYFLTSYIHWQMRRELACQPVLRWEWVPLVAGFILLVGGSGLLFWTIYRVSVFIQSMSLYLVR